MGSSAVGSPFSVSCDMADPDAEATSGVQVGLGLWSMRSTVYAPSSWRALYQEVCADARLAEALGFDSLWLAEHHYWYDGWCPQPLIAASAVLANTNRLRVGTAMHLLPQHEPRDVARELSTLQHLHGPRIDLGVGLGYRDEEYDAVDVPRTVRGRRMSSHLDVLLADTLLDTPPVYVGGIAEPAIRRAGQRGLALLLPNTLNDTEVKRRIEMANTEADLHGHPHGRAGMLIDCWITQSELPVERETYLNDLARHYREYAGAWYIVDGAPMFSRPDLLDRQSARIRSAAICGTASDVLEGLLKIRDLGVNTLVLQIRSDAAPVDYHRVMRELASHVLPGLRSTP